MLAASLKTHTQVILYRLSRLYLGGGREKHQLMKKKEAINLKNRKKGHNGGLGGRKRKRNDVITL